MKFSGIVNLSLILFVATLSHGTGDTLYWTDFDDFPEGDNQWHGTDGWVSNSTTGGVQSIDQDAIPAGGLGQTASIGFNRPQSTFNTVFRNIGFDPVASPGALVTAEILLGVQDSTNNFRDSFFVSIYNSAGEFLASIRFSNEDETYGVWRGDSIEDTYTDISFIRGELHVLTFRIDLEANLWSADLDDLPLFRSAEFCARSARERNFGPLAFEWQLSQRVVALSGNNWLLVADVRVETDTADLSVEPAEPFAITSIELDGEGTATLTWPSEGGYRYDVHYSSDGSTWLNDLPDGTSIEANGAGAASSILFQDHSAQSGERYYRIVRSATP